MLFRKSVSMPTAAEALPGRAHPIPTAATHAVFGTPLKGPFPASAREAMFGLGCFWGAERKFWQANAEHSPPGILMTSVGYAGGLTPNPTYEEVCTGRTGHNEVVHVVYDPAVISYEALLKLFFESHDPTQGLRQGNDVGTQYRSGIYTYSASQAEAATVAKVAYEKALAARGYGPITTEILPAPTYYYAEEYHQQYLEKNPRGYCGLGGTGVACPVGTGAAL